MVTVFMKVMVKRRIRGSTRSQSERSTFKIVFTEEKNTETDTFMEGIVMKAEVFGFDGNEFKTGKVSPQEQTRDKRPSAATTAAELQRSLIDPLFKHSKSTPQ